MKLFSPLFLLLLLSCFGCKSGKEEKWIFTKPQENPILHADSTVKFFNPILHDSVRWQRADVFNPAAIIKDGKVILLYRAEDNPAAVLGGRTSRIGMAESEDGIHFKTHAAPVLYPDSSEFLQYEFPGGCEDPRIVEDGKGGYVVTYTAWNQKTARLSVATSIDLLTWKKHGPVFLKAGDRWLNRWSKSGAIVSEMRKGNPVAVMINNKYWMYWGDSDIYLASSTDLVNWTPVTDSKGELVKVASPRKGFFDSGITEPGPPALLGRDGIELVYNGKNSDVPAESDTAFAPGTYGVGHILFDLADFTKSIERSAKPFLYPTLAHEKAGQYKAGTTFAEGYVIFKGKRFIYYGTADSFVGVAVAEE